MNKLGETNSDEWEKIKGWMGAANGKKDHPLVQEAKRVQRVQKFDEGVGDVEPDPDTQKFLQPQGQGTLAPSMFHAPIPSAPQITPPSMPVHQVPVQSPPQTPSPTAPPQPPPQGKSSDSQVANTLGTTPQELQAYLQKVNTPTFGERVGNGLTGLGDAIIQGVGRAGPSHMQENFQRNNQNTRENLSAIPGKVADFGKEKFGLTQTLDSQNPNSLYSKTNQNTFGPDLIKMGLTPQQVAKMPASLIGDLLSKKITLEEAKARIEETGVYQQGMLGIQKATLANTAQHQTAEEGLTAENQKLQHPVQTFFNKVTGNGSTAPSVDHSAAMQWAQSHPNDPRAAVIIQRAKQGLSGQ